MRRKRSKNNSNNSIGRVVISKTLWPIDSMHSILALHNHSYDDVIDNSAGCAPLSSHNER